MTVAKPPEPGPMRLAIGSFFDYRCSRVEKRRALDTLEGFPTPQTHERISATTRAFMGTAAGLARNSKNFDAAVQNVLELISLAHCTRTVPMSVVVNRAPSPRRASPLSLRGAPVHFEAPTAAPPPVGTNALRRWRDTWTLLEA